VAWSITIGRTGKGKWKKWIRSNTKPEGGVDEAAGRRIHTRWFLAPSSPFERREERGKVRGRKKRRKQYDVLLSFARRATTKQKHFLPRLERKEEKTIRFFCSPPCDSREVERNRGE
tara:strand:+ start:242 stop:592 length:351 start_codon:yes stop_codon:yes gene_type:complete